MCTSWLRRLSTASALLHRCNLNRLTLGFHLSFFLFFMVHDSLNVTMPLFFASRNMSMASLGLLLTASKIARALLVIPVSCLQRSRKLGAVSLAALLAAVVLSLALITDSAWGIASALFLIITTTSVFNVVMNPLLAANTSQSRLGITFGIRDVFLYGGGFLGVLATGQLLGRTGDNYGLVFIAYAALLLLLSAFVCWALPRARIQFPARDRSTSGSLVPRSLAGFDRRFVLYLAVNALLTVGTTSLVYAVLLGRQLGMATAGIYMLFSSHVLVAAALSLVGGLVIDRFDKKSVYVVSALLYVLVFVFLSLSRPLFFILAILLLGVQAALANISTAYLFSVFRGHDVDRYWGLTSLVSLAAGSLGMIAFGSLWEAGYPIFQLSLPVILAGSLLSLGLPRQAQ